MTQIEIVIAASVILIAIVVVVFLIAKARKNRAQFEVIPAVVVSAQILPNGKTQLLTSSEKYDPGLATKQFSLKIVNLGKSPKTVIEIGYKLPGNRGFMAITDYFTLDKRALPTQLGKDESIELYFKTAPLTVRPERYKIKNMYAKILSGKVIYGTSDALIDMLTNS